jgi:RNase P/RNase MRP subunit p30
MKRIFADLHLHPDFKNLERFSRLAMKASRLGYSLIGVTLPSGLTDETRKQMLDISAEAGVDLVFRVDLKPQTPDELLRSLRKHRRKFELIAVSIMSKSVARQAAKDRRVDFLNFPGLDFRRRFFDLAEAELASNSLASLEIDARPLLMLEGVSRVRLLSCLRREVITAQNFGVPIVFSSGVSEEFFMRKPLELAAFASLFDLSGASAIDAVSKNPAGVVKRNREKLSSGFVAPGIRVVRRGRDC